jgi:hypothetical protein
LNVLNTGASRCHHRRGSRSHFSPSAVASLTVSVRPAISVPLSARLLSPQRFRPPSDKGETFRASGIAICDDLSRFNLADRAEHMAKVSFCGLERKDSNELFLPLQEYMLQIQIHESQSPLLCSVDFRFDRMTPKGRLPRKQWPSPYSCCY